MKEFISVANQLADAAGDVICKYYRQPIPVDLKSDNSPVTKADQEAEKAMHRLIHKHFPQHGIIGEEYGVQNEGAKYVWVLDPIDGTASFIAGRPIFVTLIALLHKGKPILGIIDQPITKERWYGDGKIATLNSKPIHVRECSCLEDAVLATTGPQYFTPEGKTFFDSVSAKVRRTVYGGDGYNYAMLASGHIDVVIEEGLKLHDVMALIPIIEGAGGKITDWKGNDIAYGQKSYSICATGHALHRLITIHD
ncbi:MAG: histidinol-phosphatase [Rickettsiales bacterium]